MRFRYCIALVVSGGGNSAVSVETVQITSTFRFQPEKQDFSQTGTSTTRTIKQSTLTDAYCGGAATNYLIIEMYSNLEKYQIHSNTFIQVKRR